MCLISRWERETTEEEILAAIQAMLAQVAKQQPQTTPTEESEDDLDLDFEGVNFESVAKGENKT